MPPKPKITRDMVIAAAFEITRKTGVENINARTVSKMLNCSTQPVMYHFATINDLKEAVYAKADRYQTDFLVNITQDDVMMNIGLNYIRFAVEEPQLFRLLFQSGFAKENNLLEMINSPKLAPVLSVMQKEMNMDMRWAKEVFMTLAMYVHGCASIIVNNSLQYDEELIATHLERVYKGAVLAVQEEMK